MKRDLIGLEIGLDAGACPAVTRKDRLDYFEQTVNIAARVEALAGAGEVIFTDDILPLGAAELGRLPDRVERCTAERIVGDLLRYACSRGRALPWMSGFFRRGMPH